MFRNIFLLAALVASQTTTADPLAERDFELQSLLQRWSGDRVAARAVPVAPNRAVPAASKAKRDALEHLEAFVATAAIGGTESPTGLYVLDNELLGTHGGESCETAVDVAPGQRLERTLATGERLWLRVRSEHPAFLTTRGSDVDAALDRWDGCSARAPVEHRDDDFGLQVDAPLVEQAALYSISATASGRIVAALEVAVVLGGRVTREEDGTPVPDIYVSVATALNVTPQFVPRTGADGRYSVMVASGPGAYYLRTAPWQGNPAGAVEVLVHEGWPGSQCRPLFAGNDFLSGIGTACPLPTPQGVVLAADRTDIDFAIGAGATLGGRVTSGPGVPVANATVRVKQPEGYANYQRTTTTSADGHWQMAALLEGSAKIAVEHPRHVAQLHAGQACQAPCDPASAPTPVSVSKLAPANVDTTLTRQAFIDANIGIAPGALNWVTVYAERVDGGIGLMVNAVNGIAQIGPLEPGEYRLRADATDQSFDQWFDRVDCATDCTSERPLATSVGIAAAEWRTVDMPLRPWPDVAGRVTDATGGAPLAGVQVQLKIGSIVRETATTDADGHYRIALVRPGTYSVVAVSTRYEDRAYPDIPCERANPEQSCPGIVRFTSASTSTSLVADFALRKRGSVRGRVLLDGVPLSPSGLEFIAFNDNLVPRADGRGRLASLGNGYYELTDLSDGYLYVGVQDFTFFRIYPHFHRDQDCSFNFGLQGCFGPGIVRLELVNAQEIDNVDFNLHRPYSVYGRVVDARDGSPVAGAAISMRTSNGQVAGSTTSRGDGSFRVDAQNSGNYRVAVVAQGHIDQVFGAPACEEGSPGCSPSAGTLLDVPTDLPELDRVQFSLSPSDAQFREGFE